MAGITITIIFSALVVGFTLLWRRGRYRSLSALFGGRRSPRRNENGAVPSQCSRVSVDSSAPGRVEVQYIRPSWNSGYNIEDATLPLAFTGTDSRSSVISVDGSCIECVNESIWKNLLS